MQYRQKRLALVDARGLDDNVLLQGSHHHSHLLVLPDTQNKSIETEWGIVVVGMLVPTASTILAPNNTRS